MNDRANASVALPLVWVGFTLQAVTGWSAARGLAPAPFWAWLGSQLLLATTIAWWWHRQVATRRELSARLDAAAAQHLRFTADQAGFVDQLAHEIKTPLTVVVNRAEILQRCSTDANAVRAHARELADYALNYANLVDAFLRLAGPAPAPDARHHTRVHVYDLVLEAVRRLQPSAGSRDVGITATFAEPAAARDHDGRAVEVLGDERLLLAMLDSLLRHAVRSAPRHTLVTVQVDTPNELVLVRVRSSAKAPSPTASDAVLDAYFTAGDASPPRTGDARFAICRRIASHHGGRLRLPGSTADHFEFVVQLPRCRDDLPSPAAASPPPPQAALAHAPGRSAAGGTA